MPRFTGNRRVVRPYAALVSTARGGGGGAGAHAHCCPWVVRGRSVLPPLPRSARAGASQRASQLRLPKPQPEEFADFPLSSNYYRILALSWLKINARSTSN